MRDETSKPDEVFQLPAHEEVRRCIINTLIGEISSIDAIPPIQREVDDPAFRELIKGKRNAFDVKKKEKQRAAISECMATHRLPPLTDEQMRGLAMMMMIYKTKFVGVWVHKFNVEDYNDRDDARIVLTALVNDELDDWYPKLTPNDIAMISDAVQLELQKRDANEAARGCVGCGMLLTLLTVILAIIAGLMMYF